MPSISKILCPIDFSRHSQIALEHAESIAAKFGADIQPW